MPEVIKHVVDVRDTVRTWGESKLLTFILYQTASEYPVPIA